MALMGSLRKTCAAFAFRAASFGCSSSSRPYTAIAPATCCFQHPATASEAARPPSAYCRSGSDGRRPSATESAGCRLFSSFSSSSFQPAPPPGTHGTPVFPDIDFTVASDPSSESAKRDADPRAVFVVTGASRGIGLQMVKGLAEKTKGSIVACCRSPESAHELNEYLASAGDATKSRIRVLKLDVEDQLSIEAAGKTIRDEYDRVDLLLNVAGLLGDGRNTPGPERALAKIDRDWLEKTLSVNVVGPVMLTKELSPLLMHRRRGSRSKSGAQSSSTDSSTRPISIVVNLSARVGSISDNQLGGWYSYRISKSALNQATRTMALEMKRHSTWCVSLHPGTTNTGLSKPFQANVKEGSLFPVEFTVEKLLAVIDSMTEANSGGFYDWADAFVEECTWEDQLGSCNCSLLHSSGLLEIQHHETPNSLEAKRSIASATVVVQQFARANQVELHQLCMRLYNLVFC